MNRRSFIKYIGALAAGIAAGITFKDKTEPVITATGHEVFGRGGHVLVSDGYGNVSWQSYEATGTTLTLEKLEEAYKRSIENSYRVSFDEMLKYQYGGYEELIKLSDRNGLKRG